MQSIGFVNTVQKRMLSQVSSVSRALTLGGNSYFTTAIKSSLSIHRRRLCAVSLMVWFVLPMDVLIPNMTAIDIVYNSCFPSITLPLTYERGSLVPSWERRRLTHLRTDLGPRKANASSEFLLNFFLDFAFRAF